MPPGRPRGAQSRASPSSNADSDSMPPPTLPASKSPSPVATRHKRNKSSIGQPASPRQLTQALTTKPHLPPVDASPFKFVLAAAMTMLLSGFVRQATSAYTVLGRAEISAISQKEQDDVKVASLLGWRVVVLAVYWFGRFDVYDVASLTVLTSMPVILLQGLFYRISPFVLVIDSLNALFSVAVPFSLLRPIAPAHHPGDKSTKTALRNRAILTDPYTTVFTSVLAAAILAVLLELGFETFLPTFLIQNFEHIRTLEPAHRGSAQLPILLVGLLPAGFACRSFLFAPSTSVPAGEGPNFDTQTSGLIDHIKWNLWGWYSKRQKVLIARTTVLTVLVFAETVLECVGVLAGVSVQGALAYAGLWVFGLSIVAEVLDWVSTPSDH